MLDRGSKFSYYRSGKFMGQLGVVLLLLAIYRFLAHVPIPGVNYTYLEAALTAGEVPGVFLGAINLLSGGTVVNFSLLALGLTPYLSAGSLTTSLTLLIPGRERQLREDPSGAQRWARRMNLYLMIPLGVIQAFLLARYLNPLCGGANPLMTRFGLQVDWPYTLLVVGLLTAGGYLALGVALLLDKLGIPDQGVNLILMSGIAVNFLRELTLLLSRSGANLAPLAASAAVLTGGILLLVFLMGGRRRIPIWFPGAPHRPRGSGRFTLGPVSTLPLPMSAGKEAVVGAQSLVLVPAALAILMLCQGSPALSEFAAGVNTWLGQESVFYTLLIFVLVVVFTFVYTHLALDSSELSQNLRRAGVHIPNISPGKATEHYLKRVISRITLLPAMGFALVAILPWLVRITTGLDASLIDGDNLIVLTGAVLEAVGALQVESIRYQYR